MKREEKIDTRMTVGSLSRSKSLNKSSDMIVEDGIESHRRTRLTMMQRKLESDLMGRFAKERELLQGLRKVVGAEALNG